MVREVTGVQGYYQKLSKQVMLLVSARVFIESLDLTGNPSERDMELAMMAHFERKDLYEAIRIGTYVPNPALLTRESRAGHWLEAWRVLRVSDKHSGAAASAAHCGSSVSLPCWCGRSELRRCDGGGQCGRWGWRWGWCCVLCCAVGRRRFRRRGGGGRRRHDVAGR